MSTHRSHAGVKFGAKQLNIFRIGCKTSQYLWQLLTATKIDSSYESSKIS
jgi:hypothetical protein